jgi:hypothetical protein
MVGACRSRTDSLKDTLGNDGVPDEIDVMVFSENELKTQDSVEVTPFAIMVRQKMAITKFLLMITQ